MIASRAVFRRAEVSKTTKWPDFGQFYTRTRPSGRRHPLIFDLFATVSDPNESREDALASPEHRHLQSYHRSSPGPELPST